MRREELDTRQRAQRHPDLIAQGGVELLVEDRSQKTVGGDVDDNLDAIRLCQLGIEIGPCRGEKWGPRKRGQNGGTDPWQRAMSHSQPLVAAFARTRVSRTLASAATIRQF